MPSPRISCGSRVEAVIRSACRRRFFVLTVEQLALALAMILGGGILMLLLGTEILNWYWLILLLLAGLTLATTRIRARMLSRYRVAQILDRRFQLSDSLSTAWFLLARAEHRNDPVSRFQMERAEEIAASVRPSNAFPFTGRRIWALTGALAAVAFGLFAIRYLVLRSLSLEPPLVPIQLASVFERIGKSLLAKNRQAPIPGAIDSQQRKSPQSAEPRQSGGRSDLRGSQNAQSGKPDEMSAGAPTQKIDEHGQNRSPRTQEENRQSGSSTAQSNPDAKAEPQGGNRANSQERPKTTEQQADSQQGSSGLVDKMKDALSSLMAEMRPSGSSQKSLKNGERSPDEQKGEDQTVASQDQKSPSPQNGQNEQATQQQSTEGQAKGQTTEKAQASQGRNSDQSPDKKGSDAHSGVGRQDGDKNIKEAEQLQSLGKLEEIIGKRSANVTGEIMVETPSGKQQLKTEYSQRLGRHSDLGGEINRDEIPLMYRQYIRDYMEQVRKQQGNDR